MLLVLYGVPGSGKSTFMVNMLLEEHCEYRGSVDRYHLKKGTCVVHNIAGLKVGGDVLDLDKLIEKFGKGNFELGVQKVFCEEFFVHLRQYKTEPPTPRFSTVVFLIDEAWKYFPARNHKLWDSVKPALSLHRHTGIELVLATQNPIDLHKGTLGLAEYMIRAKPRSTSLSFGRYKIFHYDYMSPSMTDRRMLFSKHFKASNKIFKSFRSFEFDETTKPKNALRTPFIAMTVVGLILLFSGFMFFRSGFLSDSMTLQTTMASELPSGEVPVQKYEITPTPTPQPNRSSKTLGFRYKVDGWIQTKDGNQRFLLPDGTILNGRDCMRESGMFVRCSYDVYGNMARVQKKIRHRSKANDRSN